MAEAYLELDHHDEARALFGSRDENLKVLSRETGAQVVLRGSQVRILGVSCRLDGLNRPKSCSILTAIGQVAS